MSKEIGKWERFFKLYFKGKEILSEKNVKVNMYDLKQAMQWDLRFPKVVRKRWCCVTGS